MSVATRLLTAEEFFALSGSRWQALARRYGEKPPTRS